MKISIDYGHGGKSPGAVSRGIMEKDLNRKVGELIKIELERKGIEIHLTRKNDETIDIKNRVSEINRIKPDYAVSIHHNAGGGEGAEVIHSIKGGKGELLAQKIAEYLSSIQRVRRIYSRENSEGNDDYYGIIREVKVPTIIIELGFVDNVNDFDKINDMIFQRKAAQLIAEGICEFTRNDHSKDNSQEIKTFRVQVGAFKEYKNAENLASELKKKGYDAVVI